MSRRTLLLITSLLVAAVGVALIGVYVRGADQRAVRAAELRYGPRPVPTVTPRPATTVRHAEIEGVGMTIEVEDAHRAMGILNPGDLIALYVVPAKGEPHLVAGSVHVMSVGSRRASTQPTGRATRAEAVPETILGLDVTLAVAEKIMKAEAGDGTLTALVLGPSVQNHPPGTTPTAATSTRLAEG